LRPYIRCIIWRSLFLVSCHQIEGIADVERVAFRYQGIMDELCGNVLSTWAVTSFTGDA